MRLGLGAVVIVLCCHLVTGCATTAPAPSWRSRAMSLIEDVGRHDGAKLFPQEYRSLLEAFEHGEAILRVKDDEQQADPHFLLAVQKGELLAGEMRQLRERQKEEQRRLAAEAAARAEEERLMREAALAEARLREQESKEQAAAEAAAKAKQQDTARAPASLPMSYTVRRGESLPQIAGRSEIYNDSSLWPLIYRANRDQIRDPKRLWPGQALSIPRHFSRDDANEARRFSGKK